MKKGYIHSVESFSTQDGPGVRYVIFFQGCQLRCKYCQNPDTWHLKEGDLVSVTKLITKVSRCKNYFGSKGGVTISGGEPTLQLDFLVELLKQCKEEEIHTAIDTSGYVETAKFQRLLPYLDLVLLDIKSIVEAKHQELTGVSNQQTLKLLEFLEEKEQSFWVRYVVVPGITDELDELKELVEMLARLEYLEKVQLLAYHKLGIHKWKELGLDYQLEDVNPAKQAKLVKIKELFTEAGINVEIN